MNIYVYAVGRLSESWWRDAAAEYVKRCGRWCRLTVVELPESRLPKKPSRAEIEGAIEKEGAGILARLPARALVVGLLIEGKQYTSEELASMLDAAMTAGRSDIAFVIGGSHGLSKAVKDACAVTLSFSPMTFPHQLSRVMLLEQLYRALSILAGSDYHK